MDNASCIFFHCFWFSESPLQESSSFLLDSTRSIANYISIFYTTTRALWLSHAKLPLKLLRSWAWRCSFFKNRPLPYIKYFFLRSSNDSNLYNPKLFNWYVRLIRLLNRRQHLLYEMNTAILDIKQSSCIHTYVIYYNITRDCIYDIIVLYVRYVRSCVSLFRIFRAKDKWLWKSVIFKAWNFVWVK